MTLSQRLRTFFQRKSAFETQPIGPVVNQWTTEKAIIPAPVDEQLSASLVLNTPVSTEPLPYWLTEQDALRDEGVLFGLSTVQPDEKISEIQSYYAHLLAPLESQIGQFSLKINELDEQIEQQENRVSAQQKQINELRNWQLIPTNLLRTAISLLLSVFMCVGNYYLIASVLQPVFPNQWIAVGVFLAGMFNLFGQTSFFYQNNVPVTGRRLVEEVGLPLATAVFVFIQSLQSQPIVQASALFIFVFFLFLLAGKLFLSSLTALQTDLLSLQTNRQLAFDQQHHLPVLEANLERLRQGLATLRAQKWPVVSVLTQAETQHKQLNTKRDQLVNLFLSEFELARSLRDRLTEKQRAALFN